MRQRQVLPLYTRIPVWHMAQAAKPLPWIWVATLMLTAINSAETTFNGLACGGIYTFKNPEQMGKIDNQKCDFDHHTKNANAESQQLGARSWNGQK